MIEEKSTRIDDVVKIIQAIGSIWPFLLVVFLITITIIKWKTIWGGFGKLSFIKVRGAGAEIELSKEQNKEETGMKVLDAPTMEEPELQTEDAEPGEELFHVYMAYEEKNYAKGREIFQKIQQSATNENDKISNELLHLRYQFLAGLPDAQIKLTKLSKTINPTNVTLRAKASYYIALNYQYSHDYDLAISEIKNIENVGVDSSLILDLLFLEVECLNAKGDQKGGIDLLIASLSKQLEPENKYKVLKQIASIYYDDKEPFLRALALETALTLKPSDTDSQFSLAYAYSQANDDILTMFHYDKLLKFSDNHASGLNNLGVVYGRLKLQMLSTIAYKKSAERDNSLAASNLAILYMNAGFYDEAKLALEKGENMEDANKNINSSKVRLNELLDNETKSKNELLEAGRKKRDFYTKMAEFCFKKDPNIAEFAGRYQLEHGLLAELSVTPLGYKVEWKSVDINGKESPHIITGSFIKGFVGVAQYRKPQYRNVPAKLFEARTEHEPLLTFDDYQGNFFSSNGDFHFLLNRKESNTESLQITLRKATKP